jgi:hypothetical protein
MDIKLVPLSRLEVDPKGTLSECVDSGRALVVELPDHRLARFDKYRGRDSNP